MNNKVIIDLKLNNLTENDIIVYNGKEWISIKKEVFLGKVHKKISELEKENGNLKEDISNVKKDIEKMKNNISTLAKIMRGEK